MPSSHKHFKFSGSITLHTSNWCGKFVVKRSR